MSHTSIVFKNVKDWLRFLYLSFDKMLVLCMRPFLSASLWHRSTKNRININLGSGPQKVPGFIGMDLYRGADVRWDLGWGRLPLKDGSCDAVVCNSALNYFSYGRAQQLIHESWRVLRAGGVARVGVQDLESIARRYVEKDIAFFFQKLPDGRERFEGKTIGDKFAAWFYGYKASGNPCRYLYDFESLAALFKSAGFSVIEKKQFLESKIEHVALIDNRQDQMFFLEAMK